MQQLLLTLHKRCRETPTLLPAAAGAAALQPWRASVAGPADSLCGVLPSVELSHFLWQDAAEHTATFKQMELGRCTHAYAT